MLSNNEIRISVSTGGRISVNGKRTKFSRLAEKVKSLGATAGTRIMVSVPKDVSKSTISDITRSLASAGFPRIIFTKPRQTRIIRKE